MATSDTDSGSFKKSWSFDPEIFSKFKKATEAIGASPQSFFRKVMQDLTARRYLNFDLLDDDVQAALIKRAKTIGTENMQTALSSALREWLAGPGEGKTGPSAKAR
jgi:hypothetical protein